MILIFNKLQHYYINRKLTNYNVESPNIYSMIGLWIGLHCFRIFSCTESSKIKLDWCIALWVKKEKI